nr:swm histone demethylase complex subunit phf1 [Quercus suber]
MDGSNLSDPREGAGPLGLSSMDAAASYPPPSSTSGISEPPLTDRAPSEGQPVSSESNAQETSTNPVFQLSEQTTSVLDRIRANGGQAANATLAFEAAKEQMMRTMATTDKIPTPSPSGVTTRGGKAGRSGKGPKRASLAGDGVDNAETASQSPSTRGRGRGRPPGKARGSRGRAGGKNGTKKREDREDDDDDDSDSSEVYTPAATQTKSGRAIQKPTVFVPPPPPSPAVNHKRKRTYRRNPESAVCKVCLRGTSPTSNMIVFCDGCNTPYHRYCHHPPIDQSVVDQLDKEWYCRPCEKERNLLASEVDVSKFVPANGASLEERQRYFLGLPPKLLVRLLTRATTLQPSLPVFSPEFKFQDTGEAITITPSTNGHSRSQPASGSQSANRLHPDAMEIDNTPVVQGNEDEEAEDEDLGPPEHPANYPRPGYGLMRSLPPEQDDQQWLVDDEDQNGVFTHVYRADASIADTTQKGGKEPVT